MNYTIILIFGTLFLIFGVTAYYYRVAAAFSPYRSEQRKSTYRYYASRFLSFASLVFLVLYLIFGWPK